MTTYVTSLSGNARRAHIGTNRLTACGLVFTTKYRTSEDMPADRAICGRCVQAAHAAGRITREEADRLRAYVPPPKVRHPGQEAGYTPADIAALIDLYIEGYDDKAVAVRLGLGLRSVVRRAQHGMTAAHARTRFQWGFKIGMARGRAEVAR